MKIFFPLFTLMLLNTSAVYALSKDELLKIPFGDRQGKYVTIVGISDEYAIPGEEYDKLSPEVRKAIFLEKGRARARYAIENIGKKIATLDFSRLYDAAMDSETRFEKDQIVDYKAVCGIYFADCLDCANAIKYCRKHYLEWKKSIDGSPSLFQSLGGGDYAPDGLYDIEDIYKECGRNKELEWFYADYNKAHWLRLAQEVSPTDRQQFLDSSEGYQAFMEGWKRIKKLAQSEHPKPLSPAVQNHGRFYSDKPVEVLKALAYYNSNRVRFMLEKAAKDKRPAISKKAKEYLDNWDNQGAQNRDKESAGERK